MFTSTVFVVFSLPCPLQTLQGFLIISPVPPQTVHVYWNSTASPVTFLTFSSPGGLEAYLAELAEAFDNRPYDAELAAQIATRYDQFAPDEQGLALSVR